MAAGGGAGAEEGTWDAGGAGGADAVSPGGGAGAEELTPGPGGAGGADVVATGGGAGMLVAGGAMHLVQMVDVLVLMMVETIVVTCLVGVPLGGVTVFVTGQVVKVV